MSQSLHEQFGDSVERVERALEVLRQGRGVLVMDDEQCGYKKGFPAPVIPLGIIPIFS